ncbi:MPN domain-containing protein [Heracleum sosnowskyi]|uniref:MPN domain-containing protein n=1 Tax=Heracleum sosnowskyi TaxID=360622 RepID=A0AAD8MPT0_9APIA|nr:MPN domain-containing protein [Heracleum sosnowskyi]
MGMWRRVGMILVVWLSGFGRMFAGAGGALSHPSADAPTLDSSEQVYISSLALLKMLKHGRAGVPMEVMGLMLGEFVDEYTVRVVDVFAMPQSGTGVSVEAVDHVFQTNMLDMLKQTGRMAKMQPYNWTMKTRSAATGIQQPSQHQFLKHGVGVLEYSQFFQARKLEQLSRFWNKLRYSAEAHVQAMQFDDADKLCKKTLEIHREHSSPASLEEAADRRLMALICEAKGDYESALEHLVLASMAMIANGQDNEVAAIDVSIVNIYLSLSRFDEAVFSYKKALTVFKSSKGHYKKNGQL